MLFSLFTCLILFCILGAPLFYSRLCEPKALPNLFLACGPPEIFVAASSGSFEAFLAGFDRAYKRLKTVLPLLAASLLSAGALAGLIRYITLV